MENKLDLSQLCPRDKYVLSRLNDTIQSANKALESYDFGGLTSCIYSFWLYDICDTYLELIKPIMAKDNCPEKVLTQQILFICLDNGLRLLHPVMPYVTEELWQRLPGQRFVESICISSYPKLHTEWSSFTIFEENMSMVKNTIRGGRSLRAEYNLLNNVKPNFYIHCHTKEVEAIISAQVDDFSTLVRAGNVDIVTSTEAVPAGCAMFSVSGNIQIYVLLKGLVDFENEIEKLKKKLEKLDSLMQVIVLKQSKDDYAEKTPEAVRTKDNQKLEKYVKEKETIQNAIQGFKNLM